MADVDVGATIRRWREWSSGSIDELTAIGMAFVWSLGLEPLPETTASAEITRRTIRYYISIRLIDPPEGERRLAVYRYRHLLQLLYIKARQSAGDRLDEIRDNLTGLSDRDLESTVFDALPPNVPAPVPSDPSEFRRPAQLSAVLERWRYLTGRRGRWAGKTEASAAQFAPAWEGHEEAFAQLPVDQSSDPAMRQRVEIDLGDDTHLSLPADHPLVYDEDGRELLLRRILRLMRAYRRGGGPAGREH